MDTNFGLSAALVIGIFGGAYYYHKNQNPYKQMTQQAEQIISEIQNLKLSVQTLKGISEAMYTEMTTGLSTDDSSKTDLQMIPTFVGKPTGNEAGTYYAIDLGGTNFRVMRCNLPGNRGLPSFDETKDMKAWSIPEDKFTGTGEALFGWMADRIKEFVGDTTENITVGFTFSFPVKQEAINKGTLKNWTKKFTASGVKDQEVVGLLNKALKDRKMDNIEINALANDTVGTLITKAYNVPTVEVGIILGTGTNAAYVEPEAIPKFKGKSVGTGGVCINTEWGAFGNNISSSQIPFLMADTILDSHSPNPSKQRFEKLISGEYMGRIVHYILVDLKKSKKIFTTAEGNLADNTYTAEGKWFKSWFISTSLADNSKDLTEIQKFLEDQNGLGFANTTLTDRLVVQKVCEAVLKRSAGFVAAALYALLRRISKFSGVTVAVDGSVFEKNPTFEPEMKKALASLDNKVNVDLKLSKDGSGIGAAIISAVAKQN